MRLSRHSFVAAMLFGGWLLALPASAQTSSLSASDRASTASVPAEVLVVLAEEKQGKIDPELQKLTALRRPPFNSFRSMKVLSKPKLALKPGKDEIVTLGAGGRRTLTDGQRIKQP